MLPRVKVFSLGGTISSVGSGGKGVKPTLTAEDLVADVPQIAEVAEISAISFRQAASGELTVTDLVELASEIERSVDEGTSGAVITQGTDTVEETAFALDLLVDREAPRWWLRVLCATLRCRAQMDRPTSWLRY